MVERVMMSKGDKVLDMLYGKERMQTITHASYWSAWDDASKEGGLLLCGSICCTLHRWHPTVGKPGKWLFTIGMAGHDPHYKVTTCHDAVMDDFGNLVLVS